MKFHKRDIWEKTQPEDLGLEKCVFCDPYIEKEYIIYETRHWRVLHNKYPVL